MTLANKLTLGRMASVPVMLAVYYMRFPGAHLVACALFIFAALTDLIDGHIARSRGQVTDFGKFMDPIADKLLVVGMLIALCGDGKVHPMIVFVIIAREFAVSGVRLVAASGNAHRVIAASWLGKVKTNVQIAAVILLLLDNWPFAYLGIAMDQIAVWAALVFTAWSGVDYIVKNWQFIGENR